MKKINIVIIENKIKNIFSNQKGMALLTTLIFVFLLATFVIALLTMASNNTKLSALQRDSTQAFYVAEAGVEYARHLLGQFWDNWDDPGKFPITEKPFGSGTFGVVVTGDTEGEVVITSTGIVGTAKRVIEAVVEFTVDSIFGYAIAGKEEVKLEDEVSEVVGNVYCEGVIRNEGVTVEGTGIATGTVIGAVDFIGGTQVGPEYLINFPTLDLVYYKSEAQKNGLVVSGNLDITNDDNYQVNGIIYVEGNVKFTNSTIIGPGIIVAEGSIALVNNSTSKETVVGFFSNSENSSDTSPAIKIEAESLDIYGVIFAPRGNVKMDTNLGRVHGSVIGGATGAGIIAVRVERGAGVFHYDASIYLDLLPSDPVPTIISWREKV